ncbi:MAG: NAD(P)-dependent oxidoreductase [Deltaproteobacteria bacterium]|nr:NAD(P)-dependent oxidoreductase [Deltaproteobacteria bacterium]MBN2671181.1 NAD(P)-dependent oxidoreductase [Deltaproteobacteria bacterium]
MLNVILGADGLIGSALKRILRENGEAVAGYDIKTGTDLRKTLPSVPTFAKAPIFVWFLAWDVGGAKYIQNPDLQNRIMKHNMMLCANVFPWLEAHRLRFLFTGSQLAGSPGAYGRSKAVGAQWTRKLGGQLAILWNVYDAAPVSARSHVIPDMVSQALNGHIHLQTNGQERRRFLYVDDCVEALIHMRDSRQSEAHICGNRLRTIEQVAKQVCRLTGAELTLGSRMGSETAVTAEPRLAGWRPRTPLNDGLMAVIRQTQQSVSMVSARTERIEVSK